ncbi:hypothetical protein M758_UG227600 [Ceratodon purpureus]|nr:hypothetical protein M758_UG227600 [Ceratodon purpureus]
MGQSPGLLRVDTLTILTRLFTMEDALNQMFTTGVRHGDPFPVGLTRWQPSYALGRVSPLPYGSGGSHRVSPFREGLTICKILLFGKTGDGKSIVANALVIGGIEDLKFTIGHGVKGCTYVMLT